MSDPALDGLRKEMLLREAKRRARHKRLDEELMMMDAVADDFHTWAPRTAGKEQVLAFPKHELDLLGFHGGVLKGEEARELLDRVLSPSSLDYIDRDHAEKDPGWLQVIPYAVVMRGREVFRYRRTKKGGEGRLHGLVSIGIGGHVHPSDGDLANSYAVAFQRELDEEIEADRPLSGDMAGCIFDPSNDVGKVHFGVAHFLRMRADGNIRLRDEALAEGQFQHIVDLQREVQDNPGDFENWTKMVVEKLL